MRNGILFLLLLLAVFVAGAVMLLNRRFEKGDMYPEFSSLRADPLGTRALYESLQGVGGLSVRRNFTSPDYLKCERATVFFTGVSPRTLGYDSAFAASAIALASRNNRVVIAMDRTKNPGRFVFDTNPAAKTIWSSVLGLRCSTARTGDSAVVSRIGGGAKLPWPGALRFSADSSWRPIVTKGTTMLLGEKRAGSGSIVALHGSYHLSNQGLRENEMSLGSNPLVPFLVGSSGTVIFDEWHNGVERKDGMSELVARFGMTGVLALAAAWFLLFAWTSRGDSAERGRTDAPGEERPLHEDSLGLLLASYLPSDGLISTCKDEWRAAFPRRPLPDAEGPGIVETYNALCKQLSPKRI